MNRNIKILLAVSALFGLGSGAYEFVFPYYLAQRGVSFAGMGVVFALPTVGVLLLRVFVGRLSDLWGRKVFYSASLGASALATWATPLAGNVPSLTLLKTAREAAGLTRETMHPILLWEDSRPRFLDFVGKTRGAEFIFMGLGSMLAGAVAGRTGNAFSLRLAAMILGASLFFFVVGFREEKVHVTRHRRSAPDLLSPKMDRNLLLIAISGFIFTVGLSISHCFVMQLFFTEKFGAKESAVAAVMLLHRITLALPMLFIGQMGVRNLKAAYIGAVVAEGLALSGSVLAPTFLPAAAIWLLHDLVGAGIWQPIQNEIIQRCSRDGARGLDVGKVMTIGALGGIFGPLIAGAVFERHLNAPFLLSGLLVIAAAGPLLALRVDKLEELEPAVPGVEP